MAKKYAYENKRTSLRNPDHIQRPFTFCMLPRFFFNHSSFANMLCIKTQRDSVGKCVWIRNAFFFALRMQILHDGESKWNYLISFSSFFQRAMKRCIVLIVQIYPSSKYIYHLYNNQPLLFTTSFANKKRMHTFVLGQNHFMLITTTWYENVNHY